MELSFDRLDPMLDYIRHGWQLLRRTKSHLLQAAHDPKLHQARTAWPVYVSEKEDIAAVAAELRRHMSPEDLDRIDLRRLPTDHAALTEHGLLYVPDDYVVPGGRFNELYGWDSYWIVLGLLRNGAVDLAQSIVDNFLYEIEHYGKILNANRTYYLTRSQPPFLTSMALAVYKQTGDRVWLKATLPAIETFYRYWTQEPHLTPETGLSRYYDSGDGPAPEVLADEKDEQGRTHYERVKEFYRSHLAPPYDYGYQIERFYDATRDELTPLFYIGDRSMRESGFDPSDRFGRFNVSIVDYNPVCLNSLLYLMERETGEIYALLGKPSQAISWRNRAAVRAAQINHLLWDEASGLYFDYNFVQRSRRNYPFMTTFYPLWTGIAGDDQAKRVILNLPLFEASGGLQTSTYVSGSQWDAPMGWAPLQMIAISGLRRYGAVAAANRIAINFIGLVLEEFGEHGVLFEKYNVVQRTFSTHAEFGYMYNVVGFGWTNGTILELLADLPRLS
jgi:alpha,alpha-trehalase